MGSSSSKFRKHLQNGDEYAALQLYNSSSDLRKALDPNSSYGDTYSHDTPLHFAARHAMKSLLRVFLMELGGNPNKKNCRNETSLHCVCMVPTNRINYAIQQRRLECLSLVLQWRGATLENGEVERVDLAATDEKMNTALHYAAASGLKRCVDLLVSQNAPLFTENKEKQTPCDCAEKSGHNEIALFLESKMVFSNEEDQSEDLEDLLDNIDNEEGYSGLRAQDLQEAKDQLLVETSDMLHVPLFTAEALLRNHEWSREMLLEAWMEDAVACCEKCGVVPPPSIYDERPSTSTPSTSGLDFEHDHDLRTPTHTAPPNNEAICDICTCLIPSEEEPVPVLCEHRFCRSCWERYLTVKIEGGETHNITCPGYNCLKLVPAEIIETLVSRDMARRYLQFDIKAFVESNPSIKWCPYPGCGRAVKLPDFENPLSPSFRSTSDTNQTSDTSHAVDCGAGHLFCWECLGEAHEPASCENWTQWHKKIAEIKPEEMSGTEEETEMAANCLWLVTNSKPCPNCKSPIQKNEGCNHMKCSKCKHDFCWVCLEAWKKHSSATGGYFRCNRYEVVRRVEDSHDHAKTKAEEKNRKMQELNRFVHYYTRFKNHENSYKLEEPLLSTAKEKMMVLAKAVTDPESANLETKFVEDAVIQILKSRRVLKCSYVYGYYLEETGYKKPIFEFMQTELEECTETLSEIVARPYLRTPRSKIIQTAHLVQRKRQEFVTAIAKGLVPPDTSPTLKKKKKQFGVEVNDDLKKALLASMQDLDPDNPWVKDPSGKHTNVSALLDWPEESDDSDNESSITTSNQMNSSLDGTGLELYNHDEGSDHSDQQAAAPPMLCARKGCRRRRASNPRTGEQHEHCSMKCMRLDRMERTEEPEPLMEIFTDYQMDLLRALEMSRLQFLQEMGSLRPGSGDRSPRSPAPSTSRRASDRSELDPDVDRSPCGVIPLPSRSPRLLSSQDAEMPIPSLVLCDPPPGKNRSTTAGDKPMTDGSNRPKEANQMDLEADLENSLRLSDVVLTDEDQDLKLAIELSLRDAATASSAAASGVENPAMPCQSQSCPASTCSRDPCAELVGSVKSAPPTDDCATYSPEYSTIVTRVPNKSIEHLAIDDGGTAQQLAAVSRDAAAEPHSPRRIVLRPNQTYFSGGRGHDVVPNRFHGPKYHFVDNNNGNGIGDGIGASSRRGHHHGNGQSANGEHGSSAPMANPFGIMKDISVNNIVPSDKDKTKDFREKDFSQLFGGKSVVEVDVDVDVEAVVFEPRPPCPLAPVRQLQQQQQQQQQQQRQQQHHWRLALPPPPPPPPPPPQAAGHRAVGRASHGCGCGDSSATRRTAQRTGDGRPRQLNLEESLDHALQNLNDLTRHLTRDDSIDSIDMVIDSKVLESLLQGAEGYAGDADHRRPSESEPRGGTAIDEPDRSLAPPGGRRAEDESADAGVLADVADKDDAVYV